MHLKALEIRKLMKYQEKPIRASKHEQTSESSLGQLHDKLEIQSTSFRAVQGTINSTERHVTLSTSALLENQQSMGDVKNTVREAETNIETKLDELAAFVSQIPASPSRLTTASSVHCSEEILARVLRYELKRVLTPVVERSLSNAQSWNELLLQEVKEVIEKSAAALSYNMTSRETEPRPHDESPQSKHNRETTSTNREIGLLDFFKLSTDEKIQTSSARHLVQVSRVPRRLRPKSSPIIWSFRATSLFGNLRIEIRTSFDRAKYSATMTRTYDITVHLWPSWFLLRRSVSLRYSTEPNNLGYYQICPVVVTYPIIADDAPVWNAVKNGDVSFLSHLFSNGLASPHDQDDGGYTLLHSLTFLLQQGADPNRVTVYGETPHFRFIRVFSQRLLGMREYWLPGAVDQASHIVQALESAGCDPEDCKFDIKHAVSDRVQASNLPYMELQEWAKVLRCRDVDTLQHAYSTRYDWGCLWWPDVSCVEILLACGLDPNNDLYSCDDSECSAPLLLALRSIRLTASRKVRVEEWEKRSNETAISLIRAGADVFRVKWYTINQAHEADGIEWVSKFGPLLTPTVFAQARGVERQWSEVLKACGLSPEEVFVEDLKRRTAFLRSHGAERTGIDGFGLDSEERNSSILRHRAGFHLEVC
ncbi:uncharacterized protein BDZ99DRAFT_479839 [Mytilinidion resinicola]|uniref:Ankyrin n=1 Tax=Mytilinidion resinicola TaxID=574789 RepID=A0A6A6YAG0_9PEZI|nr:uncharacterized protein BDZ99DRAFT_479839 [Mytilinidion resinicola]KAF2805806.1 hypothetical protein BDZ99DRAFT_479839 [Mytilinidion resinicola]